MAATVCPICESGHLHHQIEDIEVEYMGHTAMRPSHYSVCDACGSEQATAADLRHNKRDTLAFRKMVMGLLTGAQVRALRQRWGMTQETAARVFGGGPVAFSKYEADDVIQSEAMDKLLRLADEMPLVLQRLRRDAGVVYQAQDPWQIVAIDMANAGRQQAVITTRRNFQHEVSYG
ncbi:type II toxin-antitoxin system MqsA family antitoxin [Aeromonas sp. EERV15]|uniref:type II toxin-antitoxin system MqsA family antitoxin n=1 Tax=Aeromonas sp. EERV15 TaxID=1833892 RepID=UPI00083A9D17|nr:type II toxin-antitoxin system MqsA family antitoxin [Aeromonas sp. EERV15]